MEKLGQNVQISEFTENYIMITTVWINSEEPILFLRLLIKIPFK